MWRNTGGDNLLLIICLRLRGSTFDKSRKRRDTFLSIILIKRTLTRLRERVYIVKRIAPQRLKPSGYVNNFSLPPNRCADGSLEKRTMWNRHKVPPRTTWHRNRVIIWHQSISEIVSLFYLHSWIYKDFTPLHDYRCEWSLYDKFFWTSLIL